MSAISGSQPTSFYTQRDSRTHLLDPISSWDEPNASLVKEYVHHNVSIRLFQDPSFRLSYALYAMPEKRRIDTAEQLEVEGLPSRGGLVGEVLKDTFAKVVEYGPDHYKLSLFQKGLGGGWGEMASGAIVTVGGIGVAAVYGPILIAGMASGALMGAGISMMSTGYGRDEDEFDVEFAKEALKGALGGAATGVLGGGVGGSIVKKVGASTVLAKQSIHAVANAAGGVLKNVVEAKAEEYLADDEKAKEKAREKLSARNLIASAAGGVAGGIAGGHVGKHAAKISDNFARAVATSVGGTVAGGTAGAAAGAGTAVVVNAIQGKKDKTEGVWEAAKNGGSTGMIVGASAASRVGAKHFLKNQTDAFKKTGKVSLNTKQTKDLTKYLKEEIERLEKLSPSSLNGANQKQHIQELKKLLGQVNNGKLNREALHALYDSGGLSQLDNPELETLVCEEVEEQLTKAAQKRIPTALPAKGEQPASTARKDQMAEGTKKDAPSQPEPAQKSKPNGAKKGSSRTYGSRGENQRGGQAANQATSSLERGKGGEALKNLDKEIEKIRGKIQTLNGFYGQGPMDPELLGELKNEINLQKYTEQLLKDPHKATEEVFRNLEKVKDQQFILIPGGTADQAASVIYRQGDQLYLLEGNAAEEFMSKGAEAMGFNFEGQRFRGASQVENSSLFSRIAEKFEQVKQDYLSRAQQAAPEPSLPSAGKKGPDMSFLRLFTERELHRIQGILNHLQNLLVEQPWEEAWQADLRSQGEAMAANLDHLKNI